MYEVLYFRSGYVNISIGYLKNSGAYGYNWSSRKASDALYTHFLDFDMSDLYPSYGSFCWYGLPLRCLAKQ